MVDALHRLCDVILGKPDGLKRSMGIAIPKVGYVFQRFRGLLCARAEHSLHRTADHPALSFIMGEAVTHLLREVRLNIIDERCEVIVRADLKFSLEFYR